MYAIDLFETDGQAGYVPVNPERPGSKHRKLGNLNLDAIKKMDTCISNACNWNIHILYLIARYKEDEETCPLSKLPAELWMNIVNELKNLMEK